MVPLRSALTLVFLVLLVLPELASAQESGSDPWTSTATEVVPRRSPMGEAVRSLLLPGWGQERMGAENRAFTFAFLAGATLPFATGVFEMPVFEGEFADALGIALYALVATLAGADAYELAERSNRENGWELDGVSGLLPAESAPIRIALFRREF